MSEIIGPLSGNSTGTCNLKNQIAVKNSVTLTISDRKNGGGTASIVDYGGTEKTEEDGKITVSQVNYRYACKAAVPPGMTSVSSAQWAPGLACPPYRIDVPTAGEPAGTIEITIDWKVYIPPPEKPSQGQTKEEWISKKIILDEGIDVEVIDDSADNYGKSPNKFPDDIDLYISDVESAKRKGMAIIWNSVKKRDGSIQGKYNPLVIPGDVFRTSDSSQKAYDLNFRCKGIDFSWRAREKPVCQYLFKERYFEGE